MPSTTVQSFKPRSDVLRKRKFSRIDGQTTPSGDFPRFRASTPAGRSTPARSQTPTQHRRRCPNPLCTRPDVRFNAEDNSYVCQNCSTVAEQDSGLVAEQQFNEERGGRITAQGQTIGQDQTHQRPINQPPGSGNAEQHSMNRKQAELAAKQVMENFCTSLRIPTSEVAAALRIWTLAYPKNFVLGRGISNAATVCLYMALRGRKEQVRGVSRPKYPIMLIDFAEIGNVDVFSLGKMYTDLIRKLYYESKDGDGLDPSRAVELLAHGPEVLVDRFVDSLEFPPNAVRKIKDDAIRIVSRMKRDWINVGRRPAGVCGAAVILAARMNNFRRTTREVVLTAKVNEITLNKRLEEFSDLKSSELSVKDFRDSDVLDSIGPADPPAFTRARNPPKPKRKRGRPKKGQRAPETAVEIEGVEADEETLLDDQPAAKRTRTDAEGFAIPELPRRQLQDNGTSLDRPSPTPPRRSGRPKGAKNWRAPPILPEEEVIEEQIERDIGDTLSENPDLVKLAEDSNVTIAVPGTDVPIEKKSERPLPPHIAAELSNAATAAAREGNANSVSMDTVIQPWEFENDIEVASCVLSEEERKIKETIWVNANRDYLRNEYARQIKKQLKDAELRRRGIDPEKHAQERKKGKATRLDGRRRNRPVGDNGYLKEQPQPREDSMSADGSSLPEQQQREGSALSDILSRNRSPSVSPFPTSGAAHSVFAMLGQRRNVFGSSRINPEAIIRTYRPSPPSSSSPRSGSGSERRSGSKRSRHSDLVFGAEGGKGTGLLRSKSSLSAERREIRRKEEAMRSRSGTGSVESDAAGPSGARDESVSSEGGGGASASASASASPTPTSTPTPTPQPGLSTTAASTSLPKPRAPQPLPSAPATQQQPSQATLNDGSIEELIGSQTTSSLSSHSDSRSHSATPTGDNLISLRSNLSLPDSEDEDEDDDEDEYGLRGYDDDDDEDDDDDGGSDGGPATEPDLDDVFAGRSSGRR